MKEVRNRFLNLIHEENTKINHKRIVSSYCGKELP